MEKPGFTRSRVFVFGLTKNFKKLAGKFSQASNNKNKRFSKKYYEIGRYFH